jgi:MEDS: MEthanogen/methylotroph, DcmR Sensory domain
MSRMSTGSVELGIRDQTVGVCDHIAYFWESEEEFAEAVGFLEAGLRSGDYCVVFGHPEANERVLAVLADRGFPQESLKGHASILGGKQLPDEMLAEIAATFQSAVDGGAALIRLLGNIGWGHPDWPVEDDILQFEARVTAACRNFPCVVVCMYDVSSLTGRVVVRGGLESHPLIMCGGGVEKNPHFVPAAQYLARYLRKVS